MEKEKLRTAKGKGSLLAAAMILVSTGATLVQSPDGLAPGAVLIALGLAAIAVREWAKLD